MTAPMMEGGTATMRAARRGRGLGPAACLIAAAILGAGCGPVDAGASASGSAGVSPATPTSPAAAAPLGSSSTPSSAVALATPSGSPAATEAASPRPLSPSLPPPTGAYALSLYRQGDFVAQYTFEWCVGASIQMTLNMLRPKDDRSRALQQRLWEQARDLSSSPFGGANPIGWTAALNTLGVGAYALVSEPDIHAALRRAAAAIRHTQRPVGLVMWSGRHAWMMSGFTSLGDPATVPNFEVTGIRVLDPLYPYGDDRWGAPPAPNRLVTPDELGAQFVARLGGRVDLGVAPGYLLVLPILPA